MEPDVPLFVLSVIGAIVGGLLTGRALAARGGSRRGSRLHDGPPNRGVLYFVSLILAGLPFTSCGPSTPPAPPKASFESLLTDAKDGTVSAIDQIAGRVRDGSLSDADFVAAVDQALAARLSDSFGLRVSWGDVLDAALESGKLDAARKKRCTAEAVSVAWRGNSERLRDAGGGSIPPGITFMFQASIGPGSTISFDADIDSVQVDGSSLTVIPKETAEPLARARNPAVLDTNIAVELPGKIAGKTLVVHWRVKIKDAKTRASLAEDWDHTERIEVPAAGNGSLNGRSTRAPGGSK